MFPPPAAKLFDCDRHDSQSELLIVEGDSAARTVSNVRDPAWQAVLPMQGKPMNAMNVRLPELKANLQFAALIDAMGASWDHDDRCQMSSLRFQRFVLLFDPDADGIHARTLMLLFFYRFMRPLLDAGRVFDTHAPRWAVSVEGAAAPEYAYTDADLARVRAQLRQAARRELHVTRFRGLASLGGPTLARRCLNPTTRTLNALSASDAERALAIFQQLRQLSRGSTPTT